MKLLATADIHIGRRPARIPHELATAHSCACIWDRLIDLALREEVNAILLGGDLVDADNRFFEAQGALESGLERLADKGIQVYAVAGNHDADILPQLAESLDNPVFHLLGKGGNWEKAEVRDDEGALVQLFGWSFPSPLVATSAIPAFPADALDPACPALGLLHADVDASGSRYHPVTTSELQRFPLDTWLLGHVHAPLPGNSGNRPRLIKLGSPQGLDPGVGEVGSHGPWLIEFGPETGPVYHQISIAGVQYEKTQVDLSGISEGTELQACLSRALHERTEELKLKNPGLEAISYRLQLTGSPALPLAEISLQSETLKENDLQYAGIKVLVESLESDFQIPVELSDYQDEPGLLGILARLIADLQNGNIPKNLQEDMLSDLQQVKNAPAFAPLNLNTEVESGRHADEQEQTRLLLLTQARRLLYSLVEQRRSQA